MAENVLNTGTGSFVAPKSGRLYALSSEKVKAPRPIVSVDQNYGSSQWVPWGEDNLFPKRVVEEARKNTIIPSQLNKFAQYIYNGNFDFGTKDYDDKGNPVYKSLSREKPEIRQWLKNTAIKRYFMETAIDLAWYINATPQLTRSNNGDEIAQIKRSPVRDSRWGWPDKETGTVKECYISANWERNGTDLKVLPVIDAYYFPVDSLRMSQGNHFIYPLTYPDPDNSYYSLAPWDSVRQSGWLEVSTQIANFKKSILSNQMSPKYIVFVSEKYMKWKYSDWATLNDKDKQNKLQETVNWIEENLSGTDNAGKTLMSITWTTPDGKIEYPWEIVPVESPFKEGTYIQDSQEASSHIFTALGIDPSLGGNGPGKQFGAGSGSDKRVAYNILMQSVKAYQDILLQPLEFIRDYNGWGDDIEFWFWNTSIATLDTGADTTTKANNNAV